MKLVHRRCAGLDVHASTVVACVRQLLGKRVQEEVRTFGTTVRDLLELADWLQEQRVRHVAMEATGVYWKPVWHVLEGRFELVLANAAHVRNVPGRKTDVNDAMWLAELLAHGLIRGSFVPPQPIQELRELTRTRRQLVREVVQHTLRIQKTLQDANIKLSEVIRDVLGVSGRAMLQALVSGETDPEKLADLGKKGLKASRTQLVESLRGRVTAHHRFLLRLHLGQVDALREGIQQIEIRIQELIEPFRECLNRLEQIPGVSTVVAQVIIGEIGIDMSRFPTHRHLISWAGLCPRMDESAGKRRRTRVRKSNSWLKPVLVQAAWGAARTKEGYLHAQFLRLKSRRGPKKAVVAVAASILTAAYFMLRDHLEYKDLGGDYFIRQDPDQLARRLARRIERLGYEVHVKRAA